MVHASFTWIKEGWRSSSWARLESLQAADRLPSHCHHLTNTVQKHYHVLIPSNTHHIQTLGRSSPAAMTSQWRYNHGDNVTAISRAEDGLTQDNEPLSGKGRGVKDGAGLHRKK